MPFKERSRVILSIHKEVVPLVDDVSITKQKELINFKAKTNEVIFEIKNNRNFISAALLFLKHNLSFEELIKSTVKLNITDLAFLADSVMSKK